MAHYIMAQPGRNSLRQVVLFASVLSTLWMLLAVGEACGQSRVYAPRTNYLQRADLPPGAVGQAQLRRREELRGYFQPVQLIVPGGARCAVAQGSTFTAPVANRLLVGLQIGEVYRFQVSSIRGNEGREVYPSVEVISRLHPPRGHELRFPIPVEITDEELDLALRGAFITRVIYLESPDLASPLPQIPGDPNLTQVGGKDDPLEVADRMGRPMAILRIGSRTPDVDNNGQFTFQAPALLLYGNETEPAQRVDMAGRDPARVGLEEGRRGHVFPRLPDSQPTYRTAAQPWARLPIGVPPRQHAAPQQPAPQQPAPQKPTPNQPTPQPQRILR